MKKTLHLFLALALMSITSWAQTPNLTPWPKTMTTRSGQFTLPQTVTFSSEGLDQDQQSEVEAFADELTKATGLLTGTEATEATISISKPATALDDEGYKLTIANTGISIQASTAAGLFYAFQSLKKMLPANVAAGVLRAGETYSLPLVTIEDAPRFKYRGFMLDVSRHFFTVAEVKKFLRLMALYKMNTFHWHLTDDQGWRVEIKKYPKLTTVASVRDNSFNTDMRYGQYWTNKKYGPYFYTQEEIKDVVAYAQKLHITIVPEIEMPGHLAAAIAAYPEYSCNPGGSHSVWVTGGISTDVLNVANEGAIQFAKDILTEIAPLFPGEVFHVGGDETPTTAWQNNAECRALYNAEGMTNYSQLQSRFTKIIAEHLRTLGKRIAVWNEAITAGGANTELIKQSEATIYCWQPCQSGAAKAADLGLNAIITNYGTDGCYYINRKANSLDYGAGQGVDNLQKMYNYLPIPNSVAADKQPFYYGVQGTFWCEHVSDTAHLEHLALPRLMGIAETGWTPQGRKNFSQFVERMKQDTTFLRMAGYNYHPQYIEYDGAEPKATSEVVLPRSSTEAQRYYYKISSIATTGTREGRCIELLTSSSSLLTEYASKGATAGMLWTGPSAAENASNHDYQLWAFEPDPNGSQKYALVCKAKPNGSVKAQASAAGTGGRWSYDETAKHYNFILADNGFGKSGDNYYYTMRGDSYSNLWMNCAMNYAVNLYGNPADGQGGYWKFTPQFETSGASRSEIIAEARALLSHAQTYADSTLDVPGAFGATETATLRQLIANETAASDDQLAEALAATKASMWFPIRSNTYRFVNTVEGFENIAIVDVRGNTYLTHSDDPWANDAWIIRNIGFIDGYSAKMRIQNVASSRYIGPPAANATGRLGNLVGTTNEMITLTYMPSEGDFTIKSSNNLTYYPIDKTGPSNGGTIASSESAIRPQGTGWRLIPVTVLTYECTDQDGGNLGTFTYSCPNNQLDNPMMPTFDGYQLLKAEVQTDGTTYKLHYTNDPTGIGTIKAQPVRQGLYDLQGRRLHKMPKKGIFILNGVKIKK